MLGAAIMLPAVLITGGTKRIGGVISRRFGLSDWHVVIHCRKIDAKAKALVASLPSAELIECDLTDGDAAVTMVDELATRLLDWRVLINCAAVFDYDNGASLDPAVFAEAIAVNAQTPVRMAQAFRDNARSQSGHRVIHFLDMKIANPNPDFLSYTMAKHALASAVTMQAMAQTERKDRVYGLAPGAILPSFDQQEHEHEVSGRMNLLHRLTDAAELADAAMFLSQGWLASGETLFIDSGQHLLSQPRDVLYMARER
jgi:NAD(P)-dependent dehydrogenase (short-subunit alcohol dehydrogenase family)